MTQRSDTGGSQIVGVDMVGVAVIGGAERWKGLEQALDGQTVGSVDARRAQNGNADAGPRAPLAQTAFSINPSAGPGALRIEAARFIDLVAATVAINPCRAYVNEAPW